MNICLCFNGGLSLFSINRIKGIVRFILFTLIFVILFGVVVSFFFPLNYREEITQYSKIYNNDPFLVAAIIKVESGYNKDAISIKDARGLMQIGPTTGRWAADTLNVENFQEEMLFEPQVNIRFGNWYLRQLKNQFNDNLDLVLAAYNAGSGNVTNWLKDESYSEDGISLSHIPFPETENYLEKVKFNHKIYSFIYKNYMFKTSSDSSLYFDIVVLIREILSGIYNSIT